MIKQQECNRLVLDGASDAEISTLLDVPHSTVNRWRKLAEQRKRIKPKRRKPLTSEQQATYQLKREGFSMDMIKQVFGAVLIALVASSSLAHTPAAPVVQGDTVTIDGSFCWHDSDINSTIAQGMTLQLPGIYSNVGGTEPIKLRLPPGTHTLTVIGFPESGNRVAVEQTVTIGEPSRESELIAAYKLLEQGKNLWRSANEQLAALAPTRAEVIQALQSMAE